MNLVVEKTGSGPVLTLVHGWAMHGGLFQGLNQELAGFELRRVDLPGHGLNRNIEWPSDPHTISASLIDAAAGGWLVGWSLGGLLAMQAALAESVRQGRSNHASIRGLILIAATPCFSRREHWPHGVAEPLVEQMAIDLESDPEQVFNRFLALEVHGSEHAAADLRLLRKEAFRHGLPSTAALCAGLDVLRTSDLTSQLDQLKLPVLLIGGRRDRLVPYAALEASALALPDVHLVRIPGAAHAPFLTNPGTVADAIRQWTNTDTP